MTGNGDIHMLIEPVNSISIQWRWGIESTPFGELCRIIGLFSFGIIQMRWVTQIRF